MPRIAYLTVVVCCALAAGAVPAVGIDIGDAPSLPWEGASEHGLRLDYERERLPEDVPALLTRDVPILVRYETLRRASEYLSVRGGDLVAAAAIRERLRSVLEARVPEGGATAAFDLGCWTAIQSERAFEPSPETRDGLKKESAELAYVLGLLDPKAWILTAALDGAREGTLLAQNILRAFDHEYPTLDALRTSLAEPEEPEDPFDGRPLFPQPPPVPDADPSSRHGATLLAPWSLLVRRGTDSTEVTWPSETPWRVRVQIGHRMIVGTRITYRVLVDGKSVAAHESEGLHGGEPIHAASTASFLQGVPRGAIVVATVEIFETDIPGQHHWSPTGGRYRVLWTHTYEAVHP